MTVQQKDRPSQGVVGEGRGVHGGVAGRVAVVRWSWRMLRREWRRQVLLVGLIAAVAGAAVCALPAAAAYGDDPAGTFGSARQSVHLEAAGGAVDALRREIAGARSALGTVQVIAHRQVPVPGSAAALDLRAQDPHGPYGGGRLRLLDGRWPGSPGEIALTRSAAQELRTGLGRTVTAAGQRLAVVGLVENPARLADTFALAASPGPDGTRVAGRPATSVDLLADTSPEALTAFRQGGFPVTVQDRGRTGSDAGPEILVLALATVTLLLVALVAAAGFAVAAQRRLRQIGMLGAMGATDRQVRLVLLGHGLLVGLLGAAAGTGLGLAAWLPLAPHLAAGAGHRIDEYALPWPLLALVVAVTVAAPAAAAWWPARTLARVPVVRALSARPPGPVRARQSVWAAAVLLAGGCAALAASHRTAALLVVTGIVAVVAGLLLVSPVVIRALAAGAARAPLTARLVLRDLGRHQARSGAALAAVTLAIGLPVAISVLAAVSQISASTGNLSAGDLLISTSARTDPRVPLLSPADLARRQDAVRRYAAGLGATVTTLVMAYDPALPPTGTPGGGPGREVIEAGRSTGPHTWASQRLYVATPGAEHRFGLDLAAHPGAQVLTSQPGKGDLTLLGAAGRRDLRARTARVAGPAWFARPRVFVTPAAVEAAGWRTVTAGWLVTARHDLTAAQRAACYAMAAQNGLITQVRDRQDGLHTVRWASVAAGAGLALGVLAMTVGTIRAESAADLRTLTATGATARTRRGLTAATSGALALAGTLLGAAGAWLVLLCAYADGLAPLHHVPWLPLLLAFPGLPLLASAAGWLAGGAEPPGIARRLLE